VDMLIDQIAKGVSDETYAQDDDTLSVKSLAGSQSNEVQGRPRVQDFRQATPVLEPVASRPGPLNTSIARVAESEMLSAPPGPGGVPRGSTEGGAGWHGPGPAPAYKVVPTRWPLRSVGSVEFGVVGCS
jgi:hypothetical protein